MNKLKYLILILFFFFIIACENKKDDDSRTYHAMKFDSLEYLTSNSDVIALVSISDGLPKSSEATSATIKSVNAEIINLIYGKIENNGLKILNSPVNNPYGNEEYSIYLSNGEFIFFLKRYGNAYKPLSPFSTVRLNSGEGCAIWNQDENGSMEVVDKSKIINEINNFIEQTH